MDQIKKCKHCEFLESIFGVIPGKKKSTKRIFTEREYWLYTEVFVYLHGSDECKQKLINEIHNPQRKRDK